MWTDLTNSTKMLSGHTFHQKVLKPVPLYLCLYVFRKGIHLSATDLTCPSPLPLNFQITISLLYFITLSYFTHYKMISRICRNMKAV